MHIIHKMMTNWLEFINKILLIFESIKIWVGMLFFEYLLDGLGEYAFLEFFALKVVKSAIFLHLQKTAMII